MGQITIYRCTHPGDNINNVTDKIVFNAAKNTKIPNPFITDYELGGQSGVGDNQAVGQDTSNLQGLGKIQDLYRFIGFISDITDSGGDNSFVKTITGWETDPKVNPTFNQGRFGVAFADMIRKNVAPTESTVTNQIGLLWQNLQWKNNFRTKPTMGNFTLEFLISRGNGT